MMGFSSSSSSSSTRSAVAAATANSTTVSFCYYFFFFLLVSSSWSSLLFCPSNAQQTYINNKQLACYNNLSLTNGYLCNGPQRSCNSYLTFRSLPPYDSAAQIGYLLGSPPSEIAAINNITDVDKIPTDTLIIVPVTCSCSGSGGGFYQHNSSYSLKRTSETYFSVANDTYQGLTTCQALMNQNSVDSRELVVGLNLTVPLRCACPTRNQTDAGIRFLLSYLVTWRDSISSIAETFFGGGGGGGRRGGSNEKEEEEQSIKEANELSGDSLIFPFTPLLVPLKTQPTITKTNPNLSSPPSPTSQTPPISTSSGGAGGGGKKKKKWGIIGIAIGLSFLLALSGFLVWFLLSRRRRRSRLRFDQKKDNPILPEFDGKLGGGAASYTPAIHHENNPSSGSLQGVRYAMDSLILYKFEELQNATEFFSEDNRIKGSVYRGLINGDTAAIKRMKGDVSNEISILKQINHSNVIRLSGFCVNQGNTYLVYEFAENGSLSDWLHENDKEKDRDKETKNGYLGWKQRVQIAYHVADGLNYLHNYANPPYIHKDLKSSNILLDSNFRAKIANFGVARTLEMDNNNEGGDGALQLTRHVVGTQGYMAPEYLENGVITPKLDVFSFGVVMLELLSGREAATTTPSSDNGKSSPQGGDTLLSASIKAVLEGEDVRAKLINYIDPSLRQHEYPLDLVFSMAQLARDCVAPDLNSRPTMLSVFMSISKILSSSLDWDPSNELEHSRSLSHGR